MMSTPPPFLTHPLLDSAGIDHGFFTRHGGVSSGVYESLNGGLGCGDDAQCVRQNRHGAAAALGGCADEICGLFQIHSNIVHEANPVESRQQGDGLVTDKAHITLTVLTADCAPVLMLDRGTGMIAACHAGWRGAVGGIVEATIRRMESLGARRSSLVAVIGPAIAQVSYQVGADLRDAVLSASPWAGGCFIADSEAGRFRFDLPGYILERLGHIGVESAALDADTYADERFFSHRRATHRQDGDSGRLISMIRRSA